MKIGIVGSGHIGSTLARQWVALGHDVTIANSRGPATLADAVAKTGARAATVAEAVAGAETVVLSIPQKAIASLPKTLFAGLGEHAVVIDTGNYYPSRDGRIEAIEAGQVESAWVAEMVGVPVVKVFNNIGAQSLDSGATPRGTAGRLALSVAGDQELARAKVLALVDALGFDPVDAGSIAESWRQQPGTPCYCKDFDAAAMKAALASAKHADVAAHRREADEAARPYFLASTASTAR